ncbi:MAG: lipopolysaccharide kinase InaA family protein [Desulfuromonadaceae bacterium]|nr:lipopolysaccharide kinase InaA family protein [Desulfuromonadaceae bacterium]
MKIFEVFLDQHWQKLLQENQLADFSSIWDLETEWFEEPNIRRGGWSGVVKQILQSPDGPIEIFIKRQEGHISRTFLHPITGLSTLRKEYASIRRLQRCGVPTLETLYFAHTGNKAGKKAVLITLGLSEHVSLEEIDRATLSPVAKKTLLTAMATAVRTMHKHKLKHNCLYPKHIFVKQTTSTWDVRIIDLEKMKRSLSQHGAMLKDLTTLVRHAGADWSTRDLLYFLRAYCDDSVLSGGTKKLWHDIAAEVRRKKSRY